MDKRCYCGSQLNKTPVTDGYGIFLFYACSECYKEKIQRYRRDIMQRYECDEPIEED